MGFWENIKTDLRLRNPTIYAQWLSVTAATSLYLLVLPLSTIYLYQIYPKLSGSPWWLLDSFIIALLFPLASLSLDLPHFIPQTPFLYLSAASWWVAITQKIITNLIYLTGRPRTVIFRETIKVALVFLTTFWATSSILIARVQRTAATEYRVRGAVNVLYAVHFSVWYLERSSTEYATGVWLRIVYFGIAGMFGAAAVLCAVAWARQHQWVYSVALGGTGIEPMVLTIPVGAPRNQTVGGEAREGAIRLV